MNEKAEILSNVIFLFCVQNMGKEIITFDNIET